MKTRQESRKIIEGRSTTSMTSIFGALLTAGYASAMGTAIAESGQDVSDTTLSQLQLSYASAESVAEQYPQYSDQITAAAQSSSKPADDNVVDAEFKEVKDSK